MQALAVFLVLFGSLGAGFIAGQTKQVWNYEKELSDIIDWNTKQIHSLGVNSAIQKQNAELLIQVLNVLEGNETKVVPRHIPLGMLNSDGPIEDDDMPHTFEQVNMDQKEVDKGIRAAAQNNLFQSEVLHNILRKIKDIKNKNKENQFPLYYAPKKIKGLV